MLDLPFDDLTNPLRLADWLELYAVLSEDHNVSSAELGSGLRTASLYELNSDDEIETKTREVFAELEERASAAQNAYPFKINYRGFLELKSSDWQKFPVYIFCLCLSYLPLIETSKGPKLFEWISCLAAQQYLQGEVLGFGAPRKELPSSFCDAVTETCRRMGEGVRYRSQPSLNRQDDTLDLIAWKDFHDKRTSKIIMFGQCGAGRNWDQKLGDLDPETFWKQWMEVGSVSPDPIKSFFTPYRVDPDRWESCARKAGVLFDRCRVACLAQRETENYDCLVSWVKSFLERITHVSAS